MLVNLTEFNNSKNRRHANSSNLKELLCRIFEHKTTNITQILASFWRNKQNTNRESP